MTISVAELAISASWIIPVIPENRVLEDCALIINKGRIENIVPIQTLESDYQVQEHIHLDGHALMPGLINAHGHAAMSLLRGYADDTPLMTWLEEHIWPAEARWVDVDFVKCGAELAVAEMIMSGTTCFSDMYFFPEVTAKVAHESGIRAQIAFPIIEFPNAWSKDAEEALSKGLALHDDYRSSDRIRVAFGPHAPYTVSEETLEKVATYAEELQKPIHIHVHETAFEVQASLEKYRKRPLKRLAELGLASPLLQCVHMTQIDHDDIALLSSSGAHVIHCPDSNSKLASGICPTQKLVENDINVALGTDGASSNNDLNLFSEMQHAALLAKAHTMDATAFDAHQAIRTATINGAKALGIDSETGSLEIGKAADICAVNLNTLNMQPVYNPASQIVYAGASNQVTHVWVNGRALMMEGELKTLSSNAIIESARNWKEKIAHG